MADPTRRFPPPWRTDKMPGGHIVPEANGQPLAYLGALYNAPDTVHGWRVQSPAKEWHL